MQDQQLQSELALPNSQRATRLLTPTTPSLATGRGMLAGTKLAALLVTPFANFRITAAVQHNPSLDAGECLAGLILYCSRSHATWQLKVSLVWVLLGLGH